MAYKFQRGQAILSGALEQEGAIKVENEAGATVGQILQSGVVSGSGQLQGASLQVFGAVTAGSSIIIGSADLNEADLEKLDGITNGTVAASKAVVVDSNKDADGFRNVTMTGDMTAGTITMTGFTVDADGDTALKSLAVDDGSTIGPDSVTDLITLAADGDITIKDGAYDFNIAAHDGTNGLKLGGTLVTSDAADLNLVDGITAGTVAASKAVIVDSNKDISGFRKVSISGSSSDELIIGSGTNRTIGVVIDGGDDFFRMGHSGGAVVLSGSSGVEFVGGSEGVGSFGSDIKVYATQAGDNTMVSLSNGGVISGSNKLEIGGTVRLDGVADAALAVGADSMYFLDATDSLMKKVSVSDYMTDIAGLGLANSSGQLALDLNELVAETIASGDFLAFVDSTDNGTHKETVDDLASLFAGAGLAASSAVIAVANATNGGIGVQANDIKLDFNDLAAGAVDVASDSIAIVDADDSNKTKKESIADLVSAMAGAGLTAASGQLKVSGNDVHSKADGGTLQEGYNYFAAASSDATVSLPASPSVGDVVHAKAGNLTSGAVITINAQGSHTIDGETSIVLESPFAAVSLVYVVADNWRIV